MTRSLSRYLYVKAPDHPLAMLLDQRVIGRHRLALFDAIGPGPHPCHWCRTTLDWVASSGIKQLLVDHLDNDGRNNQPGNLVPSCRRCNALRPSGPVIISPTVGHGKGGQFNGRAKLDDAQVSEMRRRYTGRRGEQAALALEYGIKKAQVSKILQRSSRSRVA